MTPSIPGGGVDIEGVGAHVPRFEISADEVGEAWDGFRARGVATKRVPAGDEDAVTMAVAAARAALADADRDRAAVDTLAFGTTTPPVEEGDVGATVAEILGLDAATEVSIHSQSTRAGTRALVSGLLAGGPALVVAADCPRGDPADAVDHAAGAGAVALVVGPDAGDGAARITDLATHTGERPGTRFRRRGSENVERYGATGYERAAYTETVGGALDGLESAFDAVAPSAPDGNLPGRAGRVADGAAVYHMADSLGDTGAASPLFGLLAAWAAGEDRIAVVGYGDGASADALTVEGSLPVETDWPATEVTYAEYLRKRGHLTGGDA